MYIPFCVVTIHIVYWSVMLDKDNSWFAVIFGMQWYLVCSGIWSAVLTKNWKLFL
jgi:hypothetical protein